MLFRDFSAEDTRGRANRFKTRAEHAFPRENLYPRESAEVREPGEYSSVVEKVLAGFGVVVPRVLPDIKSDPGRNRGTTIAGRGAEGRSQGERYGSVTGRHKVPFVPIKTSGTEYVPSI